MSQATSTYFDFCNIGSITVVKFCITKIIDEQAIQEMGQELSSLAEKDFPKIVIDFSGIDFSSASFIGKLIILHREIKKRGGRLSLCNLIPSIYEVFVITALDKHFDIRDSEEKSLSALS